MRKLLSLGILFLALVAPALSQVETARLKVRVILVDGDLNQKPAPRLALSLIRTDRESGPAFTVRTNFDGIAEIQLLPGRYRVWTPDPIEFQGKKYAWETEITVSGPESLLDLSNDNAVATPAGSDPFGLAGLFQKYQNSVVTVWSEFGHGTGFVVDLAGLILTNQHVVGPSEYLAVQFDERRKVAATLVAFDAERDVAVLWANLAAFPEAVAAPLAPSEKGKAAVAVGDRVFTIGSPLNQKKILTTGIVSKIESRVILSDIGVNHGNSGGPLFTSAGTVVGLTTFVDPDTAGPGVSGIVRIEEANVLLERARTKMRDLQPPAARLLPVEPSGTYPVDALKASLRTQKFDDRQYIWRQGDFDVAIITPVLKYRLEQGGRPDAEKQKERRTKAPGAAQGTFQPLDDLRNWAEYVGEYQPVLLIEASPKLRETFRSRWKRAWAGNSYAGPATMEFKSDFYRMKLFCGATEMEPIHPGKIADVLNVRNYFVSVSDATYTGMYTYPYDAVSSECPTVTLQLFSEKEPDKPIVKVLDPKTVAGITADFAPLRTLLSAGQAERESAK